MLLLLYPAKIKSKAGYVEKYEETVFLRRKENVHFLLLFKFGTS